MDMSLDIQTFLVFGVILLIMFLFKNAQKPENFPPGPRTLPLIGNLHNVIINSKGIHDIGIKYKNKYGNIIGLKLNGQYMVILNSLELIKEAFCNKRDSFSARPDFKGFFAFREIIYENGKPCGIVWNNGKSWKDLKRFALASLHDFGVGRKTMEDRIQDEVQIVCEMLERNGKKSLDLTDIFPQAVSNVICSIVFGSRFEYSDPRFQKLLYGLNVMMKKLSFNTIINVVPILRYLPGFQWFWDIKDFIKDLKKYLCDQIEEHRNSLDPNNIRDFIDHYLVSQENASSSNDTFSEVNMAGLIFDLFGAGSETTATTLSWCILYLLHYPEVQDKCQLEITSITGNGRMVSLTDRRNLPYVDATLHEIQRLTTIVPAGVPHSCTENTELGGYQIPKESVIFTNIYAVHHNNDIFPEAELFKPERWLNKEGNFQMHPAFIVFSTGARSCLGENLARAELFLFFSNLMQRFTFLPENPSELPPLGNAKGIILHPPPYKVFAETRE